MELDRDRQTERDKSFEGRQGGPNNTMTWESRVPIESFSLSPHLLISLFLCRLFMSQFVENFQWTECICKPGLCIYQSFEWILIIYQCIHVYSVTLLISYEIIWTFWPPNPLPQTSPPCKKILHYIYYITCKICYNLLHIFLK